MTVLALTGGGRNGGGDQDKELHGEAEAVLGRRRIAGRRTITVGEGTSTSVPAQTSAVLPAGSHGAPGTDRISLGESIMWLWCQGGHRVKRGE